MRSQKNIKLLKEKQSRRSRFKRKLNRYRHTKSYNRITGGYSTILSFSQSRNRKILILAAAIILGIGLCSLFLHWN